MMPLQVRASNARERQVWVDRLRHCSFLHSDQEISSGILRSGADLPDIGAPSLPLTSMDSMGAVQDALNTVYNKQESLAKMIEAMPLPRPDDSTSPSCHNTKLLMIKANSHAVLNCLQTSCDLLQQLGEQQILNYQQ